MKKIFVLAAVSLAAAGSWAFYPKATGPGGYMIIIGRINTNYSLITISPTGETTTQVIDDSYHGNSLDKQNKAYLQLKQAEIQKINELKMAGWKITSMSTDRIAVVYLMEK